MELGKPLLETLFNKQIRFRIPVFQRHYVWNEKFQWKPLWEDFENKVNERLNNHKIHPHYTGSIVLFQEQTPTSTFLTYSIIDGQQRLTTFQLFIAAFREVCRNHFEDEDLIDELNGFLFNKKSFGDTNYEAQKFKLEPTKYNKAIYKSIISKTYTEVDKEHIQPILEEYGIGYKTYRNIAKERDNILGAYIYFYDHLSQLIETSNEDINTLITTLLAALKHDFQFVEIGLTANDDPQMIFETMNGRGARLTQTDLIRNFIFMRVNHKNEDLDRIYELYWDEFDDPNSSFKWHEKTSRGRYTESKLQFFIIDYLVMKLQKEVRYDQVSYQYKHFVNNQEAFNNTEEELEELHRLSRIFKRLSNPEGEDAFSVLAKRLLDMDITTIYPLILYIESDHGITEKEKFYEYLDSYITRRFLCGLTTKNYNKLFIEILKQVSDNKSAADFKTFLQEKSADTNLWPSDNVLLERLLERPIYREEKNRSVSIRNILLEIEHFKRDSKQEKVIFIDENLSIEHILPQTWYQHWPLNGETIHEHEFLSSRHSVMMEENNEGKYHQIENRNKMLHTIGNLTLLTRALNPSIQNLAFEVKKEAIKQCSTLILNTYFYKKKRWNEHEIVERSKNLYVSIKERWKY